MKESCADACQIIDVQVEVRTLKENTYAVRTVEARATGTALRDPKGRSVASKAVVAVGASRRGPIGY